jgi:hypothetical protein
VNKEEHRKYAVEWRAKNKKSINDYAKEYRKTHKKEISDNGKEYYSNHKDEISNRHKNYYESHRELLLSNSKKYKKEKRLKVKQEIFELLGNKCSNPYNIDHGPIFLTDNRCLQVDHVYGGGRKEFRRFKSTEQYYAFVLAQIKVGSKDYQLLCANCNWIKVRENEE